MRAKVSLTLSQGDWVGVKRGGLPIRDPCRRRCQAAELVAGALLTSVPARHWSARSMLDKKLSLWCGYWIETAEHRVFFAGDTGLGAHFDAIYDRLGPPEVALLPIGAYEPRDFMVAQHMNPADAVIAHRRLHARRSLGIHYDTFPLADERFGEAPEALEREQLPRSVFAPIGFGTAHEFGMGRCAPAGIARSKKASLGKTD